MRRAMVLAGAAMILLVSIAPLRADATPAPSATPAVVAAPPAPPVTVASPTPAARKSPSAESSAAARKPGPSSKPGSFAGFSLGGGHGPITVRSDTLSLDYKGKSVVFNGHVQAIQSGTELRADTLTLTYADSNFRQLKEMVASGGVRVVQGGRWATSDRAVLDQVNRTVVMTGHPVVHDGDDQIAGNRITIYLDTDKSVVEGAHAVIFPKQGKTRDNERSAESAR
jgi:lipopolysaccharide export system protein LptA